MATAPPGALGQCLGVCQKKHPLPAEWVKLAGS